MTTQTQQAQQLIGRHDQQSRMVSEDLTLQQHEMHQALSRLVRSYSDDDLITLATYIPTMYRPRFDVAARVEMAMEQRPQLHTERRQLVEWLNNVD